MAHLPNIDPDFEPQARPRAGTWPMKRPIIANQKDDFDNDVSMKLEPTIEEATSQEHLMAESMMNSNDVMMNLKHETSDDFLASNPFPVTEHSNRLVTSPNNLVTNYSRLLMHPHQTALDSNTNGLSFANLESISQPKPIPGCNFGALSMTPPAQGNLDTKPNVSNLSSELHKQLHPTSSNDTTTSNSPGVIKPKTSSRKNAWGNLSYADLITQGIESSPDKRLTLAQIYDWMVKNVPYFKDKGDSNSSAGWKNSIRHNLSLHNKFKRMQNEGTGKSSWWVINHDAKPGKPSRKRTTSLDTNSAKLNKSRARALSKKTELQKKLKAATKKDSPTWARSPTGPDGSGDFDHPLSKSLVSDFGFTYRPRTSSNASSLGGRMSPPRSLLTQDLEDDGPPPLSPLSTYAPGSRCDLFDRTDAFGLVADLDSLTGGASDLLESINIDTLNPSSPMTQCSSTDRTNIYLTSPASGQKQIQALNKNNQPTNKVLSSVDLGSSMPRARANTMPRLQPQPKYNMSESLRRQQSGEAQTGSQGSLFSTFNNVNNQQHSTCAQQNVYAQYPHNKSQQQQQQQHQQLIVRRSNDVNTINQSQINMNRQQVNSIPMLHQQRQQPNCVDSSMQMQNYDQAPQVQQLQGQSNLMHMNQKYPSDLDIDNKDIFNPGMSDLDHLMLQDTDPPSKTGYRTIGFNSIFSQNNPNLDLSGLEATNGAGLVAGNPGVSKHCGSNGSAFSFPSNQVTMANVGMQQQQQYGQPQQSMYNMNMGNGRVSAGGNGMIPPSNGTVTFGNGPMIGGTRLPPHFPHSHHVLRPQSPAREMNDFRL